MVLAVVLVATGGFAAQPSDVAARPAAIGKAGTGFFLGGAGRLVTAAHLVAGCAVVRVVPEGGAGLAAKVESRDAGLDVAVLRVSGGAPVPAALAPELPAAGAYLTAVGYPEAAAGGALARLPLTAIELPIPRPPERMPLHGAVAHPGMSGAPVVDAHGRVVGMLLGRGDPAAPGSADLAGRIGFPVAEVAVALPARWLPQPGVAAPTGEVTVARVLCLSG
ncbi:MAG: serine protease [Geminicoccaceae bacterium]